MLFLTYADGASAIYQTYESHSYTYPPDPWFANEQTALVAGIVVAILALPSVVVAIRTALAAR